MGEPNGHRNGKPGTPEVGEALQRALDARGCALQSAQARALALELLRLCELGLLVPVDDPAERPHVYNMGPSKYENGESEPC